MITEASQYLYTDVSRINVRGNILPCRTGAHQLIPFAEDLAFICEAVQERKAFLDLYLSGDKPVISPATESNARTPRFDTLRGLLRELITDNRFYDPSAAYAYDSATHTPISTLFADNLIQPLTHNPSTTPYTLAADEWRRMYADVRRAILVDTGYDAGFSLVVRRYGDAVTTEIAADDPRVTAAVSPFSVVGGYAMLQLREDMTVTYHYILVPIGSDGRITSAYFTPAGLAAWANDVTAGTDYARDWRAGCTVCDALVQMGIPAEINSLNWNWTPGN